MWSQGFRLGCLAGNLGEGAGGERGGKRMGCVNGMCERWWDIRWMGALDVRCVELRGLHGTWNFGLQHF